MSGEKQQHSNIYIHMFIVYDRFVLQPVSHIRKELESKLHNNEEKIKSIEVRAYLFIAS